MERSVGGLSLREHVPASLQGGRGLDETCLIWNGDMADRGGVDHGASFSRKRMQTAVIASE